MPRPRNLQSEQEALYLRQQGLPVIEVARRLGVTESTISVWTAKYLPPSYDADFLDHDTELRSYFLGLFVADGWMGNSNNAYIALNDQQIINDIVRVTNYRNKITMIKNKKWKTNELSGTISYRISYAKRPGSVLRQLGFTNHKTGNEFIPSGISHTTFRHFLRGLSDGDGTMNLVSNRGRLYPQWGLVCANKSLLQNILDRLRNVISSSRVTVLEKQTEKGHIYKLQLGPYDSVAIGEFMYKDSTLRIDRKHDVWCRCKKIKLHHHQWSQHEIDQALMGVVPEGRSRSSYYAILHKLQNNHKALIEV